jgi:hypothetical protein
MGAVNIQAIIRYRFPEDDGWRRPDVPVFNPDMIILPETPVNQKKIRFPIQAVSFVGLNRFLAGYSDHLGVILVILDP